MSGRASGAKKVVVRDLQREFVTDYIFPAVAGNAVYEDRYLLGTALARPLIAHHQVMVALEEGAVAVAHGATGKGNDQVRFELAYAALAPELAVVSPWKDRTFLDRFEGRADLLAFAEEQGLEVEASEEKPYSTDENLMHISYEAGLLEDPAATPRSDMFRLTRALEDTPDEPLELTISYRASASLSPTTFSPPWRAMRSMKTATSWVPRWPGRSSPTTRSWWPWKREPSR